MLNRPFHRKLRSFNRQSRITKIRVMKSLFDFLRLAGACLPPRPKIWKVARLKILFEAQTAGSNPRNLTNGWMQKKRYFGKAMSIEIYAYLEYAIWNF